MPLALYSVRFTEAAQFFSGYFWLLGLVGIKGGESAGDALAS